MGGGGGTKLSYLNFCFLDAVLGCECRKRQMSPYLNWRVSLS